MHEITRQLPNLSVAPELNRTLTRRQFEKWLLNMTVVSAVGIGIAGVIDKIQLDNTAPASGLPEAGAEIPYVAQVEGMFGVDLRNSPTASWTGDKVLMLGQFMSRSPQNFYIPQDGKQLPVSIADSIEETQSAGMYTRNRLGDELITLQQKLFNPENIQAAHDEFFHEFSHRADADGTNIAWPQIDEVLGGSFSASAPEIFNNLTKAEIPNGLNRDDLINFRGKLLYGFSQPMPNELVASLGEIYSYGKDNFYLISKILGYDVTDGFYEIIRQNIFAGVEYTSFLDSTGELEFDKNKRLLRVGFLGIDNAKN